MLRDAEFGRMTSQHQGEAAMTVLVELHAPPITAPLNQMALGRALPGFTPDENYQPVPMAQGPEGGGPTVIIRGTVEKADALQRIQERPEVVRVWRDTPVTTGECKRLTVFSIPAARYLNPRVISTPLTFNI